MKQKRNLLYHNMDMNFGENCGSLPYEEGWNVLKVGGAEEEEEEEIGGRVTIRREGFNDRAPPLLFPLANFFGLFSHGSPRSKPM